MLRAPAIWYPCFNLKKKDRKKKSQECGETDLKSHPKNCDGETDLKSHPKNCDYFYVPKISMFPYNLARVHNKFSDICSRIHEMIKKPHFCVCGCTKFYH